MLVSVATHVFQAKQGEGENEKNTSHSNRATEEKRGKWGEGNVLVWFVLLFSGKKREREKTRETFLRTGSQM